MNFLQKKKMYTKMTLWVSVLCALIIIPISILLAHQFSKFATAEINRLTRSEMLNTTKNVEFLLEGMKAYSLRIYVDGQIQGYLSLEQHDGNKLWQAYESITNYLLDEPYVHSIYLINQKNNIIFDSKHGMHTYTNFDDQEILQKIHSNDYERLKYFKHEVQGESYLGLIVNADFYDGQLVTLLDIQMMEEYLLNSEGSFPSSVYLTTNAGELLLGNDSWYQFDKSLLAGIKGGEGQVELKTDQTTWSANYVTMESNGWVLYHLMDISAQQASIFQFKRNIIVYASLLLLVIFLIVFWQSRKTYQPFSKLIELLDSKIQKYSKGNDDIKQSESEKIHQQFEALISVMNNMSDSLRKNKHLIKEENIRQWILQGHLTESMKKYFIHETKITYTQPLQLIIVRIDRYQVFLDDYNLMTRKNIKYAIGNIFEHIFATNHEIEFADFGGDHIVLLKSYNEKENSLNKCLEVAQQEVKKILKLDITIAISEPKTLSINFRPVYDLIYDVSTLKFVSGEDKVYTESDLENYNVMIGSVENNTHDMLCQAIRLGNIAKVHELCDQLFEKLQSMKVNESKFHLVHTIYALTRTFNQFSLSKSVQSIESYLGTFITLEEINQWLKQEINKVIAYNQQVEVSDRRLDLIEGIEDYIHAHIHDPMFTVDQLADHLSLSVSYVRQVFKEGKQQTISEYMMKERIIYVKDLLRNTDLKVSEIAAQSGFQTKSHFFTVFKKHAGMTPSEYRKLNIEENQNQSDIK